MKTYITVLFLFSIFSLHAQTLEDLINEASGAAVIDTVSPFYLDAKNKGIELVAFSTSGCDDSYGNKAIPTKMIKNELKNDTLTLTFAFSDACCISFLGDLEYKDDILDLRYTTFNEPCECRCYYTLEYTIKLKKTPREILFNGYKTEE